MVDPATPVPTFQVHERVRNKFYVDGPFMRVRDIDGDVILCGWFDKNATWNEVTFSVHELELV